MTERVTYALRENIATITLDDGKMNALSKDMLSDIGGAFDRAQADRATVVLTGRPGVFSAGFDLRTMREGGSAAYDMLMMGFALSERLLSFPTPIVAASTGHALAMGVFLLLSADYRVGAAGPFKVGANEVAIGLTMPFFGCEVCRMRLSPAHFHRAVINAEIYRPEDAVAAGFLDRVVPPAELEGTALAVAGELAKLDFDTYAATKLRARGPGLKALREAIEADDAIFRARPPRVG